MRLLRARRRVRPSRYPHRALAAVFLLVLYCVSFAPGFSLAQDDGTEEPVVEPVLPTEVPTDVPTETPIPTNTETPLPTFTPTDIPTDIPTATPTDLPTNTPTDLPTDVPTETPVPTNTETPTLEPTPTPETISLPAEPPVRVIGSESFEAALDAWRLDTGWAAAPGDNGQALQLSAPQGSATFVIEPLYDAALQARFRTDRMAAQVQVRQSASGAYSATLFPDGRVELARAGQVLQTAAVSATQPGQWRALRLSAIGDLVRVQVDGVEVIGVQDPATLPGGAVAFGGFLTPGSAPDTLLVDDALVSVAEWEVVPPTAIPVPTEAAVDPVPVEVTQAPVIPLEITLETTVRVEVTALPEVELTPETTPDVALEITPEATPQRSQALGAVVLAAPVAPSPQSPANNTILANPVITFQWNSVAGAAKYQVQVALDAQFGQIVYTGESTTNSHTVPGVAPQLTLYWRVRGADAADAWGPFSTSAQFTIMIGQSPDAGASTTNLRPAFTWFNVPNISNYRLQISTSTTFNTLVLNQLVNNSAGFTLTSNLNSGTTYYWRVIMVGIDSAPGATLPYGPRPYRALHIIGDAAPPVLVAPANGATFPTSGVPNITFNWNGSGSEATGYELEISASQTFQWVNLAIQTTANDTDFRVGEVFNGSAPAGTYYWRVRARLAGTATTAWSAVRSVVLSTVPPSAPVLLAPANNAQMSSSRPTFSWNAAQGAVEYWFQTDDDIAATPYQQFTVNGTTFAIPTSMHQGTHRWRAVTCPQAGVCTLYSAIRSFVIFIGTSPANNATIQTNQTSFTWQAVPGVSGASAYRLQIDDSPNFTAPLVFSQTYASGTLSASATLPGGGTYYWRVLSSLDQQAPLNGSHVPSRTLTVGTGPAVPVLVNPAHQSSTTSTQPMFSWNASSGATRYEIRLGLADPITTAPVSVTGTSYTPPSPLLLRSYFWQVRAFNGAGASSAWSTVRRVDIVSPDNAAPVPNRTTPAGVTLRWSPISWAGMYHVQIDNNSDFSSVTYENSSIASSQLTLTVPPIPQLASGRYFWRVRARNGTAGAWGNWSATGSFIVEP